MARFTFFSPEQEVLGPLLVFNVSKQFGITEAEILLRPLDELGVEKVSSSFVLVETDQPGVPLDLIERIKRSVSASAMVIIIASLDAGAPRPNLPPNWKVFPKPFSVAELLADIDVAA